MLIERFRSLSIAEKLLVALLVATLPLVNPWVRGDGVGYYAYIHALLIHHDLNFEQEWLAGNTSFLMGRVDENGALNAQQFTRTGHIANNLSVGPSMLWAPFLLPVHLVVLGLDRVGAHIPADGYSRPYVVTIALATALYAFLGLFLSFRLAREYFPERWAFWATAGIWFASSLPVYMYFNPSWSHAHSAFAVALFLWYWHRTRGARTAAQWAVLGLLAGLMADVYYPNGVLLLIPFLESLEGYWQALRQRPRPWDSIAQQFAVNVVFLVTALIALLPTLITRKIIYGGPLETGYPALPKWAWTHPALREVLFSADHGLFSWTPILLLAVLGLFLLRRKDRQLGNYFLAAFAVYYYFVASRPGWDALSSFGNRFFVSLTPIFVLGLAASLDAFEQLWRRRGVGRAVAATTVVALILWNWGFIFQWGMRMVPSRGAISWRQMAYNQVMVVPNQVFDTTRKYLLARRTLMGRIEQEDVKQLREKKK